MAGRPYRRARINAAKVSRWETMKVINSAVTKYLEVGGDPNWLAEELHELAEEISSRR